MVLHVSYAACETHMSVMTRASLRCECAPLRMYGVHSVRAPSRSCTYCFYTVTSILNVVHESDVM
jgi:hypothetical protein